MTRWRICTCQENRTAGFCECIAYCFEFVGIFFDRLCIQNLSVILANIKVFVLVLGQCDLLLVVAELEIRHIVLGLYRWVVRTSRLLLLFPLLLLLLQLLGRLLRLPCEIPCADLPAEDTSLCPIALLYAQRYLL